MNPPFSADEFLEVFRRYNEAVWPAQLILLAAGATAAVAAYRANLRHAWRWAQIAFALVAGLWLWSGLAYHKAFFAELTPAGAVFGSLFIAQAGLLLIATTQSATQYEPASRISIIAGSALLAYAFVLYPAIGLALGHGYPSAPSFGTPCPTTIFTFGIFCLLASIVPRFLMVIPLLWAVIGSYAALGFGVGEDVALLLAAVTTLVVIHHETHHTPLARLTA